MEEIDVVALVIAVPIALLTIGFVVALAQPETADPDQLQHEDLGATLKLFSPLQWGAVIGLFALFLISGLHITTGTPSISAIETVLSDFDA